MSNETELDNSLELSVQERMNLSVKGHTNMLIGLVVLAAFLVVIAVYGVTIYLSPVGPPDASDAVSTAFYLILLLCIGCIFWLAINGRKIYEENRSINREYTQQAYLIALSLSSRTGDDASLDFYDIARDIFPELKKLDVESMKESGEEISVSELEVDVGWAWSKKTKYTFDIVQDTKYGNFIIKDFKKKASYDDLEQCLKVTNDRDNLKNGLRLVCLAEDYDSDILKKYEELMKVVSRIIPVDLILVNEKGFSVLKISEQEKKITNPVLQRTLDYK